tara:strand:- start:23253 stop:23411 length:159 start_codon:yes stop_codon:yes gene_type:complete
MVSGNLREKNGLVFGKFPQMFLILLKLRLFLPNWVTPHTQEKFGEQTDKNQG